MFVQVGDRVRVPIYDSYNKRKQADGVVIGVYPKHVLVQLDLGWRESFHYEEIEVVRDAKTSSDRTRKQCAG